MEKIKIFMGDMVHNLTGEYQYTFPLGVGLIGEYVKKHYPQEIEIRYFKSPELVIEAIRAENPDIVGLSYYIWNNNLNNLVFDIAKRHNPNILTIGGGPNITNLNCHQKGLQRFFAMARNCDVYVLNQGENGFLQIINEYIKLNKNTSRIKQKNIPGCFVNTSIPGNGILIGSPLEYINELDEIPSPYLSGAFDEFFEYTYIPIIETNRSCPYRCTYCAWGIGTKQLTYYSTDRVKAEIEYIAERCKNAGFIWVCDANFSILKRDEEIAEKFYECYVKYHFPAHVMVQWNKSKPQRIVDIAKKFRGLADVVQSFQSIHEPTLKAIKRRNLSVETVKEITKELKKWYPRYIRAYCRTS